MRSTRNLVVLALAFALLCAGASAQTIPPSGFEQLKSLVGEWEGTNQSGTAVHLSYELVSGGSALMERLHPTGESEMITMYSADGGRVALTHYCSAGNQPQMVTSPISGPLQKFTFLFVRATNLTGPGDGHMVGLTLTLTDPDHLTQEWTWLEKGKGQTDLFRFTRKK
jgi:hypothetical protein